MRLLLAPDPETPPGELPEVKPPAPAPGAPAPTPPLVKKTPLKTPNEIRLEKEVSILQDKVSSLDETIAGINSALEGLQIGGPAGSPVVVKAGAVPPAKNGKGFFSELESDIWGN